MLTEKKNLDWNDKRKIQELLEKKKSIQEKLKNSIQKNIEKNFKENEFNPIQEELLEKQKKLEKIMTQKWIAAYGNTIEAWVDHRRTGYPKLPYNYQNSSKADTGIIPADGFIKRMLFNQNERTNNPSGYAGAVQALGGEDLVSTRLYWDIEGPNF